jgi:AAA+ ATPase superfamily predicted ATPase
MERRVLSARNPLFGRRTAQLALQPLRFRDAGRFFPDWPGERRMWGIGVMGGVPAYLKRLEPEAELEENILRSVLSLGAPLLDEPRFLMMEELREPQVHFSICRAMAHGHGRPNEIAQAAGLTGRGNIASYLRTLQELRFVERRVPATVRNPERSRMGLYRLGDPFLRFWFRFVLPNRSALEAGNAHLVWRRKIAPHLAKHVSAAFEDACREHLEDLNRREKLPAVYDRIGGWWRGPDEVDVLAVSDEGALVLGECKWTEKPAGIDVLARLTAKVGAVQADLKRPASRIDFAVFARAGFTEELAREARKRGVLLYDVGEVLC